MIGRVAELYRGTSSERAVAALVLANLVPLAGVLFFGWSLHTILVLYWVENGIVGLWNLPKLALAGGPIVEMPREVRDVATVPAMSWAKVALVPFFLFHYGMFWLVHGVFVFVLPVFASDVTGTNSFGSIGWTAVLVGGVALFISHGASFFLNYLARREYRTTSPTSQMGAPYARVVVLHLTIIFGAFAVAFLGSPIGALIVMVVVKTAIDLALHVREHGRGQPSMARSTNLP